MDRQGRQTPFRDAAPGRKRLLAGVLSGAAQLILFGVLFLPVRQAQEARPEQALQVSLLPSPKPPGPSAAQEAAAGAPQIAPPTLPKANAPTLNIAPAADTADLLSDSQLAGAARAGEGGGGGGGCDMARAVQQALRRDRLVFASMASAQRLGKAMMLWNGDWVRSGGEDGKGLSAVREAILWEVGFAPENCRNTRMHGMVLLSLADGGTRFAVGTCEWRWSDLLGVRR